MTVGVMGTGRIGHRVIQDLQGFGCRILAYDVYQNAEVAKLAEYTDLDTLYKESDIITLHMPLLPSTHHKNEKGRDPGQLRPRRPDGYGGAD